MSLSVRCFATIIDCSNYQRSLLSKDEANVDGHIEIHSDLYEININDFIAFVNTSDREVGRYSINVKIGEGKAVRMIYLSSSCLFTNYAFEQIGDNPIPMLNQPISTDGSEKSDFISSRFWAYQKYFFVTNREYSFDELREVKIRIKYIVKKFNDEVSKIERELKDG
jgi:hypothetical protein